MQLEGTVTPQLAAIYQSIDCPLYIPDIYFGFTLMRPTWLTFVVEDRLLEDRFGDGRREVRYRNTCFERIENFFLGIYNYHSPARKVEHYSRPRAHQSRQIVYGTRFYSSPVMRLFEESGCISLMVIENDTPMSSSPVVKYLPLEPPYGRRRAPSASLCASHPLSRASLGGTRQADFRSAVGTSLCTRSNPRNARKCRM